mmetsp:Transcript_93444/g.204536  ORF Transcript_93444/g.204536 Transcript_93444/m.204536 type:complete len:209 (+) Transcript_93444:1689-2315(+)
MLVSSVHWPGRRKNLLHSFWYRGCPSISNAGRSAGLSRSENRPSGISGSDASTLTNSSGCPRASPNAMPKKQAIAAPQAGSSEPALSRSGQPKSAGLAIRPSVETASASLDKAVATGENWMSRTSCFSRPRRLEPAGKQTAADRSRFLKMKSNWSRVDIDVAAAVAADRRASERLTMSSAPEEGPMRSKFVPVGGRAMICSCVVCMCC